MEAWPLSGESWMDGWNGWLRLLLCSSHAGHQAGGVGGVAAEEGEDAEGGLTRARSYLAAPTGDEHASKEVPTSDGGNPGGGQLLCKAALFGDHEGVDCPQ